MPITPKQNLLNRIKLSIPLPQKATRPMMDKVAERMRLLCQDFYLVTKDLQELLLADERHAILCSEVLERRRELLEADEIQKLERSEIHKRRKELLVKLAQIESDILDLSTLVGWHKFLDEIDRLGEKDNEETD